MERKVEGGLASLVFCLPFDSVLCCFIDFTPLWHFVSHCDGKEARGGGNVSMFCPVSHAGLPLIYKCQCPTSWLCSVCLSQAFHSALSSCK